MLPDPIIVLPMVMEVEGRQIGRIVEMWQMVGAPGIGITEEGDDTEEEELGVQDRAIGMGTR